MLKIIPRNKYVLVRQAEPASRENEFGLLTPTTVEQEQRAQGEVLAVGKEIKDVKKGDKVIYGAFAGETIEHEEKGKKIVFKLLHDDDVLAFLN